MQIDKLAISTQPRSSWQAFDLGGRLAIQWWRQLCGTWLIITFPPFLLIALWDMQWAIFIVWLCKPLFERALLYIYSRQVFAEHVSIKQALKAWPSQLKNQWLPSITWLRLSPSRGFNLPVAQLEGLNSFRRADRLRILHQTKDSNTGWWTIICAHIEMFFVLAFIALIQILVPQGVDLNLVADMWMLDDTFDLIYGCCLFLAWAAVAPLYIGGSFTAYLNRRIILEGWDVELSFKKISRNHQVKKAPLLMVTMCCLALSMTLLPNQDALAQDNQETENSAELDAQFEQHMKGIKGDLEEIKSQPPFGGKEMVEKWRWTGWEWDFEPDKEEQENMDLAWLTPFLSFIAKFAELILWLVFGGIILALLWLTRHQISALFNYRPAPKEHFTMPSFTVTGEQNTLPNDVDKELARLVELRAYRLALSLMLVSSLQALNKSHALMLHKAMTEMECLAALKQQIPADSFTFMQSLIGMWRTLAWAHSSPNPEQLEQLLSHWRTLFSQANGAAV